MAASGPTAPDSGGEEPRAPPGGRLGRYIVLSKLGAGAMGVVFSAHDPELDRKVAIKLLKFGEWDEDGGRLRLQREAQALARLAHRNVVAVYDVGAHEDQLFVAMEFVSGQTIGAWMGKGDEPRPWREVLRVFVEAGRGLAAAHGAGLVHRDFKPDNGMISDQGEVRVMDFGLARSSTASDVAASVPDDSEALHESAPSTRALASELTQSGAMMGTPAYMSAEQLNRQPADARSDQFSFCVALYEALYGERPFAGASLVELIVAVNEGEIRDAPPGSAVPAWLRKVVVRGLARQPEERYPSMDVLLAAMLADPATQRRRRMVVAGATVGAVGCVGAVAVALSQPPVEVCQGLEDNLVGVWDDTRRAAVNAALVDTGLSYAPSTFKRVGAGLDAYATRWVAARTDACQATHRGEQSAELLDLRMACLNERLEYLSTTTDLLVHADATVVDNAVVAVGNLPTLQRCSDLDALKATRPPPEDPDEARRVAELDTQLRRASALRDAAKYDDSLQEAREVVTAADAVAYAPLQARAWLLLGEVEVLRSDYDDAAQSLGRGYDHAVAERMVPEAARASALLMHMFGYYREQHQQARAWAVQADPLSRAVGTDVARALFLNNRGAMTMAAGRPAQARDDHVRALALRQAALGDEHPVVAESLTHLGNVARDLGQGPAALDYYGRALAIRRRVFGGDHPLVGASLYNMGAAARTMGQIDQAQQWLAQALQIRQAALGPGHPYVASTLYQLGSVARLAGDYARSRQHHAGALAIWRDTLGAEHPDVAWGYSDLGAGAQAEGDLAKARVHYDLALQIRRKSLGPNHPLVASSLNSLGQIALAGGNAQEAQDFHRQALTVADAAESAAQTAESLLGLARGARGRGDDTQAIAHLERALALAREVTLAPARLDEIRFALAQVLADAEPQSLRDAARALSLAEAARFDYGEQAGQRRAERDAWLARVAP